MIYSKSYNFLFCHVPKTGGTSLRFALRSYRSRFEQSVIAKFLRKIPNFEFNYFLYDFTNRPHTTCQNAANLLGHRYEKLFVFCLMRNPAEWVFSSFLHFKRHNMKFRSNELINSEKISFEEYLCELIELGEDKPSQSFMVVNNNGRLIVDSVGLFESLSDYYSSIKFRLGLKVSDELKVLNSNKLRENSDMKELVTNKKINNLISEYWQDDCTLWNFVNQNQSFEESLRAKEFSIKAPSINLSRYDPWGYMKA